MDFAKVYREVFYACFQMAVYGQHDMEKKIKKWLPYIKEVTEEVIQQNCYNLDDDAYEESCGWWNSILSDISDGLLHEDTVLLEDAIEFGLKEFLECFFTEDELRRLREEAINEQENL